MRALVTGVSLSGIGGAICRRIARDAVANGQRARITMSASTPKADLDRLAAEVTAIGAEVRVVTGDLGDASFPKQLVQDAIAFGSGLDALVLNAAAPVRGSMLEIEADDWTRVFNINTRSALLMAQAAFNALKASRGAIVVTGSISGVMSHVGYGPYSPSKAALIMLAHNMSDEWAPHGIRVNIVSPGPIHTPLTPQLNDPAIAAERASMIPAGRIGRPEDIAGVVSYLLGPDGVYTIGQNILVDGGLLRSSLNRLPGLKLA